MWLKIDTGRNRGGGGGGGGGGGEGETPNLFGVVLYSMYTNLLGYYTFFPLQEYNIFYFQSLLLILYSEYQGKVTGIESCQV